MLERQAITPKPASYLSRRKLSRREFLQLTGAATGAIATGYPLATEVASSLLGDPEAEALAAQGLAWNVLLNQLCYKKENERYREEFGAGILTSLSNEYNSLSNDMIATKDWRRSEEQFLWLAWKTLRLVATYELNTLLQDTWENKYAVSAPGTLKRPPEKIKIPGKAFLWEDIYWAIAKTICTPNNPIGSIRVNLEASGKGMTKEKWKSDRGERWPDLGYCWGVVVKPPYANVRTTPSAQEGRLVSQLCQNSVVTMTKEVKAGTETWHETPRKETILQRDTRRGWFLAPDIVFISGDVVTPTYFLPPKL